MFPNILCLRWAETDSNYGLTEGQQQRPPARLELWMLQLHSKRVKPGDPGRPVSEVSASISVQ